MEGLAFSNALHRTLNGGAAPHCWAMTAPAASPSCELDALPAAELPLPAGSKALFVLKRRHRLSVTEAEAVDAAGGVEWNTRCSQVRGLLGGTCWPDGLMVAVPAASQAAVVGAAGMRSRLWLLAARSNQGNCLPALAADRHSVQAGGWLAAQGVYTEGAGRPRR